MPLTHYGRFRRLLIGCRPRDDLMMMMMMMMMMITNVIIADCRMREASSLWRGGMWIWHTFEMDPQLHIWASYTSA